jgi:hypothetical protein
MTNIANLKSLNRQQTLKNLQGFYRLNKRSPDCFLILEAKGLFEKLCAKYRFDEELIAELQRSEEKAMKKHFKRGRELRFIYSVLEAHIQ